MTTVTMIDTIGSDAHNVPGTAEKVAYYVTGSGSVPWPPDQVERFAGKGKVRIDQTPALLSYKAGTADVADVERGAGTTANFVIATRERIARGQEGYLYCDMADLPGNVAALLADGVNLGKVGFWVADWDLSQAEASAMCGEYTIEIPGHGNVTVNIDAVQWASPSSNPRTLLPGTKATLSEVNADLSETVPGWFAYKPPTPPPVVTTVVGVVVTKEMTAHQVISTDSGKSWTQHAA